MRRRSYAVHAQNFDEYKNISLTKALANDQSNISPYNPTVSIPNQVKDARSEAQRISREAKRADPDLWNDFDFKVKTEDPENLESLSQASTNDTLDSPVLRFSDEEIQARNRNLVLSSMVIGSREAQIEQVINQAFANSERSHLTNRNFDLTIKEAEEYGQKFLFKFWLQQVPNHQYQHIINAYYTNMRNYIFIYRADNRQSFECLDSIIENVKAQTKTGKFLGLLICDKTNSSVEEVGEEEAELLRAKHGLLRRDKTQQQQPEELRQELFKIFNQEFALPKSVIRLEDM